MMKTRCKWRAGVWLKTSRLSYECFFWVSRPFFEKRMGQEIDGEALGEDYKGYIFKITGGNDAQGFPMKQGIMKNGRTRILFKKGK